MKELLKNNYSIQSYIDENREKIDESLVSLRLMKEIDEFLDFQNVNQREFSTSLGCSEAYVSQLMSLKKKFNTSFINKFEKKYDVEISFKIKPKKREEFFSELSGSSIQINVNLLTVISSEKVYSFENRYQDYFSVDSGQMLKLNYNEK